MIALSKILGSTLAAAVLGTALINGGTALAANATPTTQTAVVADKGHDRGDRAALDALRTVLDDMVKDGKLTTAQRDTVIDAVRKADWDGVSVERLGDILGGLVKAGTISAAQRDAIVDGVRHADRRFDRFVMTLDRLTRHGTISRDQKDAIMDAVKKADWDGFSVERLGDILGGLVTNGTISSAQRDAIMDALEHC